MSKFKPRRCKATEDGSRVTLYKDSTGSWYIGHPGPDLAYHPTPMGAFATEEGARRWADRRFPGGSWDKHC